MIIWNHGCWIIFISWYYLREMAMRGLIVTAEKVRLYKLTYITILQQKDIHLLYPSGLPLSLNVTDKNKSRIEYLVIFYNESTVITLLTHTNKWRTMTVFPAWICKCKLSPHVSKALFTQSQDGWANIPPAPLPLLAKQQPLIASAVHLHWTHGGNEIPMVMDGLSLPCYLNRMTED